MHHENRIIDLAGCFSFGGHLYEAGTALAGAKVEIAYDPLDKRRQRDSRANSTPGWIFCINNSLGITECFQIIRNGILILWTLTGIIILRDYVIRGGI